MGWAARANVRTGNPRTPRRRAPGSSVDRDRAQREFDDGFTHVRVTFRDGTTYVMDAHGTLYRRDYTDQET